MALSWVYTLTEVECKSKIMCEPHKSNFLDFSGDQSLLPHRDIIKTTTNLITNMKL